MDLNNRNCVDCPLSELRNRVLNGVGNPQSKIVFVLDSPSKEDDASGNAFTGIASNKLDEMLARFNIHRSQVYLIYATRCRANLRTLEGVRPAHYDEIKACSKYLIQEIEAIKPNIIVPMGTEAMMAVFDAKKPKVGELRGVETWSDTFHCKVLPTYSVGAILRNPNLEEVMFQDLRRAIESSRSLELTAITKGNYLIIDSIETFDAFFERIMEQKEAAVDLETTGFDWQTNKIICCSFSWAANTGVLLPITKWIGVENERIVTKEKKTTRKGVTTIKKIEEIEKVIENTYHPWWGDKQEYIMSKFRQIMESDIQFIAQNGKFDWKFLMQMGWNLKPLAFDTLLMHYLLRETSKGEHNLEDMSLQYLGKGQHKKELDDWFNANGMKDDSDKNYARVPPELLFKYGATDADVTFQLKQIFLPRIIEEGMADLFQYLVMPLNYTLTHMEFEGFQIDPKALSHARTELELLLIKTESDIKNLIITAGVKDPVDLDSPKQLSKLLFDDLKFEPIKQTKTGFSTDEEVLNLLADKFKWIDPTDGKEKRDPNTIPNKILEFRGAAKLLRTYVLGIQERLDGNYRLHTRFMQEGTECVTKDTHIWTELGLLTVNDLLSQFPKRKKFKPYKIGLVNRFGEVENTSHLYNGGKRKTIKIKTSLGLELKATPEHPLLILRGNKLIWETLKSIKIGDFIQSGIGANIWGNSTDLIPSNYKKQTNAKIVYFPDMLTPELARLVGYWIAEGCYIHTKDQDRFGIRITNKDKKIIKDITNIIKNIFHIVPYLYVDKRTKATTVELVSKEVYEWWISNFGYQHGAKNKYIPTIIKRTNWKIIKEFLRGLSTDSCIGLYRTSKDTLQKPFYKLAVDSKQLALEVQQLLLNAGFRAKFFKAKKYKPRIKKTAIGEYFAKYNFQVLMDGHEVVRFLKEVPPVVSIHIKRMKDFEFIRHTEFKYNIWFKNNPYVRLIDGKWYLKVIKKFKYINQDVFDFTLPKTHSFVSNGLVSHNSGRLSSRDPNFQNFPRDSKLIKNMFVVDKGNVLIEADEGQNEFRWWGIYSNDPQLVQDLNDGVDIHKLMASLANKIPISQVTKKQRQAAKSIVFGLMFNMGAKELSKQHGVTIEYAEDVKTNFL